MEVKGWVWVKRRERRMKRKNKRRNERKNERGWNNGSKRMDLGEEKKKGKEE